MPFTHTTLTVNRNWHLTNSAQRCETFFFGKPKYKNLLCMLRVVHFFLVSLWLFFPSWQQKRHAVVVFNPSPISIKRDFLFAAEISNWPPNDHKRRKKIQEGEWISIYILRPRCGWRLSPIVYSNATLRGKATRREFRSEHWARKDEIITKYQPNDRAPQGFHIRNLADSNLLVRNMHKNFQTNYAVKMYWQIKMHNRFFSVKGDLSKRKLPNYSLITS